MTKPTDHSFPPAAAGLPAGTLEAAEIGANRLDAWARSPQGRNFLAHALVQLARTGWLRTEPGAGFEPTPAQEPAEPAAASAVVAPPTDHTTPPAWVDGHPQLEAIAAAVWEQCGRSDNGACVDDDPRNIAVAALSAVRNTADDQAAENKRLRAKVFEWQGSYLDEVKVRQERDAEIARLRADRAAVLRWAADRIDATRADFPIAVQNGITWATAEMRRLAADDEQPGARHVHITIHHPDPTTANTAALCIADLIHGEYSDNLRLTITTDAPGAGAAPSRQADETPDTETEAHAPLSEWRVEILDGDEWMPASGLRRDRSQAAEQLRLASERRPLWADGTRVQRRLVRQTTTYTVEPEPAAGARQDGAQQ